MNFIDLHTDMPLKLLKNELSSADCTDCGFNSFLQNAAFWFEDNIQNQKDRYEQYLNKILAFAKKKDIKIIGKDGLTKNGIILSVENGGFLAQEPNFIYKMASDKILVVSLTWNGDNLLAGGTYGKGGLTQKGAMIIKKVNELGMALDISHLNHRSAIAALELAERPLATHSNCKAVLSHKRNLSDEVLIKIKEKNGLVGICFYPEFLGFDVFEKIRENILHLLSLGMEKNIAIGSDFDGAKMDMKLSSPKDIYKLYNYLLNMGIKKSVLDSIFYENAIAFFSRMCQNK